jgi:predicted RNase H-like nuclease
MAATAGHLIGIDGYRGGWVGAVWAGGSINWLTAPIGGFASFVDGAAVICVDIPVGLADSGWRPCDLRAKELLGSARARVFMTPPRGVILLGLSAPNDEVQRLSQSLTGQGVSRQALGLASRILDVDGCLPDSRILEVHPELVFQRIAGESLPSKKQANGVARRISSLALAMPDVDVIAVLEACPGDVPIDDSLDALATLWTARRHSAGQSEGIIAHPELDARGTAMQMTI